MYETRGLFISGKWRHAKGGATLPVLNPSDEKVIGDIPKAGTADVADALASAQFAFTDWKVVPAWDRGTLLHRVAGSIREAADGIGQIMSSETGKPIAEARGEVLASADQFEWYGEEARRIFGHSLPGRNGKSHLHVHYQPIGPVAAFSPWNFPCLLPVRKIAPALAAGCSVIVKPSEEAPGSCMEIVELCRQAGLPDGVLNLLVGDPAEISSQLIESPIVRKVSFTGSVPVGKQIFQQCAQHMKRVSLELGGHAPVIIFDDADVDKAAAICARTKFRNCGQVCISPSRFYVHKDLYDVFIRTMTDIAQSVKVGPGSDPSTDMGPLVNARGRERTIRLVEDAVSRGATLLTGGKAPGATTKGFFFEPTVLSHVPDDALIMTSEPFAPIAPVASFTSFDDVMARANALPFGLAGYVFTKSLETAVRASEALEVGMVGVNDLLLATAEAPFGGIKESGLGREGGKLGILEYLDVKYTKFTLS